MSKNEELLLSAFASTRMRMEMDHIPLWPGNHVMIKQVVNDFTRYAHLPRLKDQTAGHALENPGLTGFADLDAGLFSLRREL
ncbi:MAG: hypothetical protein WCX84_06440 [Syntrophales bacterium]|nr:hypothetical protein [Syntrophales bacterium]